MWIVDKNNSPMGKTEKSSDMRRPKDSDPHGKGKVKSCATATGQDEASYSLVVLWKYERCSSKK
jgi:hypothetical protein